MAQPPSTSHASTHTGPRRHHGHTPGRAASRCRRIEPRQQSRLRLALALTALFLVTEVVGGLLSNSLALLADAGHMLTDVGALALSLFVAWFSRQPASPEKTYGYLRWEILAAFLNGAVLLVISAAIVWRGRAAPARATANRQRAHARRGPGGLVVNALAAWMLHPVHGHSLNTRGGVPPRARRPARLGGHGGGGGDRSMDRLARGRSHRVAGGDAADGPVGVDAGARVGRRPAGVHPVAHLARCRARTPGGDRRRRVGARSARVDGHIGR